MLEQNLSNCLPERIPTYHKAYYEGDQAIILTTSVKAQPQAQEPGEYGEPRLEYFDLNHKITAVNGQEKNHSWLDFYSWPTNGIVIQSPPVKENYVDIPGGNGSLDFAEVLTGYPLYENRTGSIQFEMDPYREGVSYDVIFNKLRSAYHGKKAYMMLAPEIEYMPDQNGDIRPVMEFEPWYYEGRFTIDSMAIDDMCPTWTLNYTLDPYKRLLWTTNEDWVWDAFDFEDGFDYYGLFHEMEVNTFEKMDYDIGAWIGTMPTIPTITAEATMIHPGNQDEGIPAATELGIYVRILQKKIDARNWSKDSGWVFIPNGTVKKPDLAMTGSGINFAYDPLTGNEISDGVTAEIWVSGRGNISFDMQIGVI